MCDADGFPFFAWVTGAMHTTSPQLLRIFYASLLELLSVTRSLICFRSLKSPISALNIDTGFLGFFSGLIITLTNMIVKFFCAKTESDKPWILKGGFRRIKTVMYANVFQDLIRSFALGYLKFYRHVLVNDATSNTKNQAERWMNFDSLSAERDKRDFSLIEIERRKPRSIAFTLSHARQGRI